MKFLYFKIKHLLEPRTYNLEPNSGVTFIELVVVITIFSILAGTVVFNFSRFSANISLQNLAQDIALQINAAQKEAISGRASVLGLTTCDRTTEECAPRYGIYFVPINSTNISKIEDYAGNGSAGRAFVNFYDYLPTPPIGPDGILAPFINPCGSSNNTECLNFININQGNNIANICASVSSQTTCDPGQLDEINISFKRPFPDAIIKGDDGTDYVYARLTICSPNPEIRARDIAVTSLGRISVEPSTFNCT